MNNLSVKIEWYIQGIDNGEVTIEVCRFTKSPVIYAYFQNKQHWAGARLESALVSPRGMSE